MENQALERVRGIAEAILEQAGIELVHIEMGPGSGGSILRLYIDKDGGVSLDDCSRVSRLLSAQLDVEDPIPHRYTLEVSSPGLDRPLVTERDYARFAGRQVRLTTRLPIDGRRHFAGRLTGLVDGQIHLALEGGRKVAIPRDLVVRARLEVELDFNASARGRHA